MHDKLKAIFDSVDWPDKHYGLYPEGPDEIRYMWREDEADYAGLFFRHGVLPAQTTAVKRSLSLGRGPDGAWVLCVVETQLPMNMETMARRYAEMMDPTRFVTAMRAMLGQEEETPAPRE